MLLVVKIIFFILSIIQFFAIMAGLTDWLHWHWIIAFPVAGFISFIPIVGSIVGIIGAIKGWHWDITKSILLFVSPYILIAFFTFIEYIYTKIKYKRY